MNIIVVVVVIIIVIVTLQDISLMQLFLRSAITTMCASPRDNNTPFWIPDGTNKDDLE